MNSEEFAQYIMEFLPSSTDNQEINALTTKSKSMPNQPTNQPAKQPTTTKTYWHKT